MGIGEGCFLCPVQVTSHAFLRRLTSTAIIVLIIHNVAASFVCRSRDGLKLLSILTPGCVPGIPISQLSKYCQKERSSGGETRRETPAIEILFYARGPFPSEGGGKSFAI